MVAVQCFDYLFVWLPRNNNLSKNDTQNLIGTQMTTYNTNFNSFYINSYKHKDNINLWCYIWHTWHYTEPVLHYEIINKVKYNSKKKITLTDMLHQKAMQQHSSHCNYCSVIFVMPQPWHAHLKACSTSMLGNTVRFRGRTTPDKIPSVMIFCKTPFNSGDELNNLSSDTPWKLVSCRNILMPVVLELMTDTISVTATDCG